MQVVEKGPKRGRNESPKGDIDSKVAATPDGDAASSKEHSRECEKFLPGTSMPLHVEDTSLLFIEACAGSALLSSVMRCAGFDILAIDFGKVGRNSNIHVINLDLRQKHSWQFLHTVVLSRRAFHFHGAPPCGTSSGLVIGRYHENTMSLNP